MICQTTNTGCQQVSALVLFDAEAGDFETGIHKILSGRGFRTSPLQSHPFYNFETTCVFTKGAGSVGACWTTEPQKSGKGVFPKKCLLMISKHSALESKDSSLSIIHELTPPPQYYFTSGSPGPLNR